MNWDRDRFKKVLGTKGLSAVLRQTPAFIKFRKVHREDMRAEAEAKRQEAPGLLPCHYDPEWRVEQAFLPTQEGLTMAERLSRVLNQGQRSNSSQSTSSNSN